MKYLDYFKEKIGSVPLPIAAQTVESLLVQLFSAFTELVESQINVLVKWHNRIKVEYMKGFLQK